ncbi:protein TIC 20-IV, chloroplastic-like [Punica granatum]|uniref:Protein TIC 20 n=2 Tax=Punica granatum TaxID=22663 RepID=A0A6P8BXE5_PUNGR|nr:protein TIC 20-IV, chloroplastic-like [Punica granatum]
MPMACVPDVIQKTTTPSLAPVILAANATSQWYANHRHRQWMKNPGARFKPTSSSCHFGRRGDSYSSLKLEVSSRDAELQRKPVSRSSVAPASFFGTGRDESEGPRKVVLVKLRKRCCPRAYMDFPYRIPYPEVTKKPEWWWRTLACVPYLMALQLSDAAFFFQPLMERYEQFEFLSYYIPGAIRRLPSWFLMVYCFALYVGVVRNKQWPHFFRYHVMMGLLLENVLQIVWHVSNFMPLINYQGTFGMQYWAMVGFTYIILLLECVRSALAGMYVSIPFISDAAYLHTPYTRGDS